MTVPDTVPTTTTTPIRTEPAEIFFLTNRGRLLPVFFELPPPLTAEQVADVLEAGPPSDQPVLDSLIQEGLILSSSEDRAVLTVDLDAKEQSTAAELGGEGRREAAIWRCCCQRTEKRLVGDHRAKAWRGRRGPGS